MIESVNEEYQNSFALLIYFKFVLVSIHFSYPDVILRFTKIMLNEIESVQMLVHDLG